MADYPSKAYTEQGGDKIVVESGGEIEVQSGGTLDLQPGANVKLTTPLETKATSYVVTAADSGKTFLAGAVDLKFTLPATVAGLTYTFICKTVSTSTGLQIDPAAADAIHHTTSVDNKDLINTAATDVEGDTVTLVGDGVDGWWVKAIDGIWAKE